MQMFNVDPLLALTIGVAVSILISLWNSWVLYKKGAIGRDDVIMLLKIVVTFIPQVANPAIKTILNELVHIIAERLGLPGKDTSIDELLKKLEELAKLPQRVQSQPQQ